LAAVREPDRAREQLQPLAGDVRLIQLDVTDHASIAAAVAVVDAEHGHLDVLVNNAGVALEHGNNPLTIDIDAIRATYEVNVFGVLAVTAAFLPLLRRAPSGRIVNLSSATGSLAEWSDPASPITTHAPVVIGYNSSKTALNALTVAFAHLLRDTPIKVNSADPGYVATDLNGHRGYRSVADGAAIVLELATLDRDGSTGEFRSDFGIVPW